MAKETTGKDLRILRQFYQFNIHNISIFKPETLLAIDEQRVGLDLEIVLKAGLVLQQHLDTNVEKDDLSFF